MAQHRPDDHARVESDGRALRIAFKVRGDHALGLSLGDAVRVA